jgi:hypothetical protein
MIALCDVRPKPEEDYDRVKTSRKGSHQRKWYEWLRGKPGVKMSGAGVLRSYMNRPRNERRREEDGRTVIYFSVSAVLLLRSQNLRVPGELQIRLRRDLGLQS